MKQPWSNTGYYAGNLALTEIGIGSIVHGFKVPLGGNLLAINQAFILTRALRNPDSSASPTLPGQISVIAALLKSLSPAGQKLTPKLAIATQGYLFTAGVLECGINLFGILLGSSLLSIWGVIQPIAMTTMIYGLAFGPEQISKILSYYNKILADVTPITSDDIFKVLAYFVVAKIFLCWLVVVFAWSKSFGDKMEQRLRELRINSSPQNKNISSPPYSPLRGAIRDICRPIFLLPLILTGIFFWFAEHTWAPVIWATLRPAALGFIAFWLVRRIPIEAISSKYGKTYPGFIEALKMTQSENQRKITQDESK